MMSLFNAINPAANEEIMKRTLFDRIEALEANATQSRHREPVIFFDKELGRTMQIIGNGLVVPLPMSIMEWEAMMAKHHE
jgi:hypothetical protein